MEATQLKNKMEKQKTDSRLLLSMILLIGILLVSCKPQVPGEIKNTELQTTQELKKFSSAQEVRDFLEKAALSQGNVGGFAKTLSMRIASVAESAAPQASADSGTASGSATDYSTTNIQVAGVDEADFVKNDGRYIYTIVQDNLVIVDAFPAENGKILSETKLEGRPRNILVSKDRLAVFSDDNAEVPYFAQFDFVPRPRYTSRTHVFVYDISDRSEPELVKDYNLDGYYFESRMIDEQVYFVVKDDVYYRGPVIALPQIRSSAIVIARPDIYYFDNPEQNYVFHTVASFNIFESKDEVNAKTFMMGYSNTLYVSQDNIYIAYQKNPPYAYYEKHNEERFYEVVAPLLPSVIKSKINEIKDDSSLNSNDRWDKISSLLEDMYNSMGEDERDELIQKIEDTIADYEAKLEQERRKTVIHKIKIDKGDIEYGAKGEVPGYLLNQFSLDEFNNNLRVATTMEFYGIMPMAFRAEASSQPSVGVAVSTKEVSGKAVSSEASEAAVSKASIIKPRPIRESKYMMYNNVYILGDDMKTIGKLEEIAPDERIYSARFIGDRLYMVTFKRVDPLFVIDLSRPESPEILGQLKIPGFSDYLHPYDEDHIIGIGKETESNEWGGVSLQGVKLSLFDVSDVENPIQLDKYGIGEAGTDSEALRDHKAFLFDRKKNLLVIPVTEVKGNQYYDSKLGYYTQRLWQGAYVFSLTLEDGFDVKGKITHNEGNEQTDYYYYGSPNSVRRSLFMDDVLYTVSAGKIKANDLDNINNEIKEIKLPFEQPKYYDYPIY